jgi:two-component system response regulator DegU
MFKLMTVDDHIAFRHMAKTVLEREQDFQVVAEANDGSEALRLMDDCAPDLFLIDIQMPGMNGFETARKMLERKPDAKIVLTSMNGDKEYWRMAKEVGALAFLPKRDLSASALRRIVRGG